MRFVSSPLDRRSFLSALLGLALAPRRRDPADAAVRVEAIPTIFFAQPDGRSALVRFVVQGADAPAGRLRVFDRARRQIGTAGVIGVGDQLYGELWIPLDRETDISTELELPRMRGMVRTAHRLVPRRRWVIRWVTIADAADLDAGIRELGFPVAGAARAVLGAAGILVNPLVPHPDLEFLDHAAFLASCGRAADLATRLGLELSPLAIDRAGAASAIASLPLMLAGIGVGWLAGPRGQETPGGTVRAPDGSSVHQPPLAAGATPSELGFLAGGEEMPRRIERWIDRSPMLAALPADRAVALVVGSDPRDPPRAAPNLEAWNARFAYPRIVPGRLREALVALGPPPDAPSTRPRPGGVAEDSAALVRNAGRRVEESRARTERLLSPLVSRLPTAERGLAALGSQFAFSVPGTIVFNPSPFGRTDVAVMPDGTERMVTDVPALGYACVPYPGFAEDRAAPAGEPASGTWTAIPRAAPFLETATQHLTIDPATGAITSVVTADGREWVGPGGQWNGLAGARLDRWMVEWNPGVGTRVGLDRLTDAGPLRSTVTLYDQLPWIDLDNRWREPRAEPAAHEFAFALERPDVSWDIPAGVDRAATPIERLAWLRWLRLESDRHVAVLSSREAPLAAVEADGRVRCRGPRVHTRFRISLASGWTGLEDVWRQGWSVEPFVTAPVPGTGRATLPSFGALLAVDQTGIAVVDLRPARDGDGLIVLLQDLLGAPRDVTLGPGVLAFGAARRVDFLERDLGPLPGLDGRGVSAPIAGNGFTAVRLIGIGLAGR